MFSSSSFACFQGSSIYSLYQFLFLFILFFDTESCFVAQDGLKLTVILPQPPECWDYRCITPCPAFSWLYISIVCLYHILFIHSSVDGPLDYFGLWIMLLWTFGSKFLYRYMFSFFVVYMSRIARSYGYYMSNLLKKCLTFFPQSDCPILHSH
jgi:hypothetical protein